MLSIILAKLTLQQLIAEIPHDAGAFVAYAILVAFIGFIWWGSRSRPIPAEDVQPSDPVRPS